MTNHNPDKPAFPEKATAGTNPETDDFPVLQNRSRRVSLHDTNVTEQSDRAGAESAQTDNAHLSSQEQRQQRLLLVEPSSTMRYVLQKYLAEIGYDVESFDDFKQALAALRTQFDEFDSGSEFVAVLFGWQSAGDPTVERFLDQLESPDFHDLPVIVLSQEMRAHSRAWVAGRPFTELVRWKDYRQASVRLEYMLDMDLDEPVSVAGSPDDTHSLAILIVDDSDSIRMALQDLLSSRGFDTAQASTHKEALQLAESKQFDLALLDYYLEESTGDTLCAELMASPDTGEITCAILTGSYSDHIIKRCLSAGAVECMFKNESSELLLSRINAIGRIVTERKSASLQTLKIRSALFALGADALVVDSQKNIVHIGRHADALLNGNQARQIDDRSDLPLSAIVDGTTYEQLSASYNAGAEIQASIQGDDGSVRLLTFRSLDVYRSDNLSLIDSIWKVSEQGAKGDAANIAVKGPMSSRSPYSDRLAAASLSATGAATQGALDSVDVSGSASAQDGVALTGGNDLPRSTNELLDDNARAIAFTKNLGVTLENQVVDESGDDTILGADWRNTLLLIELAYKDYDGRLRPVTSDSARLNELLVAIRSQVSLETEVAYFGSSRIGFTINHDTPEAGLMHARLIMQNCNKTAVEVGYPSTSSIGVVARLDLHRHGNAEALLADLHRSLSKVAGSDRDRLLLNDYERFLPVYPDGRR